MKTFEETKTELETICKIFKIGYLVSWRSKKHESLENYIVCSFNTDKLENQSYIYLKN